MKKYLFLLMAMMMAVMTVGLTACGDDDEPKSGINGTWERTETDADGRGTLKFIFKNNSVTYKEYWKGFDGDDEDDTYKGTYTIDE